MRRFFQVRMLIVLVALALIPTATLPFAERLRTEWTRFWNSKPDVEEPVSELVEFSGSVTVYRLEPIRDYGRVWRSSVNVDSSASSPGSSLRFSEAQELGEAAGSVDLIGR